MRGNGSIGYSLFLHFPRLHATEVKEHRWNEVMQSVVCRLEPFLTTPKLASSAPLLSIW
jgi:hypothetical protein